MGRAKRLATFMLGMAYCLVSCPAYCWSVAASADDQPGKQRTNASSGQSTSQASIQRLADLAEKEDWPDVAELVRQSTAEQLNGSQPDGMTALHWAAWHDHASTVELLLRAGAAAEPANHYGVQPLMIACQNGNPEIVRMLLEHNASARASTADGETVLMTAARTGSVKCGQLLIDRGADVNAKERKGQTAIMWAAHEGHNQFVKMLIEAGADFRASVSSGFTPLLFAARQGHTAVAEQLIKAGADVNQTLQRQGQAGGKAPRKDSSPLIFAVENGHFDCAARLIELGADPNDQRSGATPLHTLTWVRKPNRGDGEDGDPAPAGSGKMTSLQFARFAVEHGADVNARLQKGQSGRGQLKHVGATPLLLAAHTDDLPYVQLLVELGADVHLNNADDCTPLMAAAGIGVLAPGEEAGTEEEALATVAFLHRLGLSINAVDQNNETTMHAAAYKSLPKMVEWLSQNGADPAIWNRPNKYGWTPLDIAEGKRPGNFKPNEDVQQALRRILEKKTP